MADEKRYSAKEAAIAVLAKAEEMLKNSALMKAEKLSKAMPPGEIHPKEHMEGEAMHPGERTEQQAAPGNNPKEESEGNNSDWGTSPQVKGHIKLAHFLGHSGAKKQNQKNNNTGTAMGQPPAPQAAPAKKM